MKKLDKERDNIKDYEIEAQQLEQMEAELLHKLQETQARERDAFNKLESAMIDASMPSKQRVTANQTKQSDKSFTSGLD